MWTTNKRRSWLLLSCEDVEALLHFLLDNVFIQVGREVFQQCVGIPMGTNCAPLLAELLLHDYESNAMIRFSRTNGLPQAKSFEFTRRYIDDLISINNPRFHKAIEKIYPSELVLKDTTPADGKVAYLDRQLKFGTDNWSCLCMTRETIFLFQFIIIHILTVMFLACLRMEYT